MHVHKSIRIWLLTGCFLIFSMVVIGGITRLTNSGLSMVEWKIISGSIPPLNDVEWQEAFSKYQQFPEYEHVNSHFTLQDFKSIFWWEYIHRMMGRLLGIVFILPYLFFSFKKMIPPRLNSRLLVIFTLGAIQGFFGWFMVKSGLADEPDVSHYRLALHLITAFLTFSYVWWVYLNVSIAKEDGQNQIKPLGNWLKGFMIVLVVQIVYGAFVAGLNAGMVFNTYPKMENEWIAPAVSAMTPLYLNLIENTAGVQFIHRYVAVLLVILFTTIVLISRKYQMNAGQKVSLYAVGGALGLQFLLGILTLLYRVPISLGVIHQIGAFFLLAAIILAIFRFSNASLLRR